MEQTSPECEIGSPEKRLSPDGCLTSLNHSFVSAVATYCLPFQASPCLDLTSQDPLKASLHFCLAIHLVAHPSQ